MAMLSNDLLLLRTCFINKSEFDTELNDLVRRAVDSGVELAGDYPITDPPPENPNYDILITKLASDVGIE